MLRIGLSVAASFEASTEAVCPPEQPAETLTFISNIIIDGLAPTNTLAGNPIAQKQLINSGGLSLI
ncbi:MAG: poly-beta-hydroxybutyrate polymerase, partial [Pseudomonadota bacterium]